MILQAENYARVKRQKPQFNVIDIVRIALKKYIFKLYLYIQYLRGGMKFRNVKSEG